MTTTEAGSPADQRGDGEKIEASLPQEIGQKLHSLRNIKGHLYALWLSAPSFADMLAVNAAWADTGEPIESVEHFFAQWVAGADVTRELPPW